MKRTTWSWLALPLLSAGAWGATINVPVDQPDIPSAFAVAVAGDVINLAAGTYVLPAAVTFAVPNLTLQGAGPATTIQVSGVNERFIANAVGATIQDLRIEKTDNVGVQNIIYVGANNFKLQDTEIFGQFVIGDAPVIRAMVMTGGLSGLLIDGNTFHNLRQPAYVSGTTTGVVSNNFTWGTKGWVLEGGDLTFTGNTWGTGAQANVYDIAILATCPPAYHTDIVAMALANHEAVIEDQRAVPAVLSVAHVDGSTAHSSDLGGAWHPYSTITPALNRVVAGGIVRVAAGSYNEMLSITKPMTLKGANAGIHPAVGTHPTETVGTRGAETYLTHNGLYAINPAAHDITVDGFFFSGNGTRIIDTYANADRFHLTNCIFDNNGAGATTGVIQFGGGSHVDLVMDFNWFMDKGDHTFYAGGGPFDRLQIKWNKFQVEGDAVFWGASPLLDGVIQGNDIDGTIDGVPGTGFCTFNIGQGGNLRVLDNHVHDVVYTAFQVGIVGGMVTGNTFERIYPYLTYGANAFELWGGQWGTAISSNVTIGDNTFHFNDIPGATAPSHGLRLRGPETGAGIDGTTIHVQGNSFLDGGVRTDALAVRHQGDATKWVDADLNWWGHATGPFHATLNPGGLGARVGDYVTFTPFLTGLPTISQSASTNWIALAAPGTPTTTDVTVACDPAGTTWRGVNVTLTYDPAKLDLTGLTWLFNHTNTPIMYWSETTPGIVDVSITIPGVTVGQTAPASLFRATFDGVAVGDTPVHLDAALLRNLANQPITPVTLGGDLTITVDGASPVMAITTNPTGGGVECLNPASLTYLLSASDNVGLFATKVRVSDFNSNTGWITIATGLSTPTRTTGWTGSWTLVPATLGLDDGPILVEFAAYDGVNYESDYATDQFTLDRVAPTAPASLDADPAFHACDLSWTAPGDQTGYTLYWKKRTGYPYPTGLPAAWNGVGAGDGNVAIHEDSLTYWFATANTYAARGVYDFTLAATDCAGNTTRSAVFSATNYFLGDVTGDTAYDGAVESYDLAVMAAVYGSIPSSDPGREMNVGPTHNSSSYGLPAYGVTNALVNFEDLIIFAMNYHPSHPQLPLDAAAPAGPASLSLAATGEAFTLTLDGSLKGFSARVSCEATLLEAQADFPVFFYRDGDAWLVDAVSLGGNLPSGSTVTLRFADGGQPSLVAVDGRDAANRAVPVTALGGALPERFALEQNFPNPFNPVTTIRYALPEAAPVRLTLFNALGQQVMSRSEGEKSAGLHELRLDGSPLASGVYIYRLEAGRFADQKKLVLVK